MKMLLVFILGFSVSSLLSQSVTMDDINDIAGMVDMDGKKFWLMDSTGINPGGARMIYMSSVKRPDKNKRLVALIQMDEFVIGSYFDYPAGSTQEQISTLYAKAVLEGLAMFQIPEKDEWYEETIDEQDYLLFDVVPFDESFKPARFFFIR